MPGSNNIAGSVLASPLRILTVHTTPVGGPEATQLPWAKASGYE